MARKCLVDRIPASVAQGWSRRRISSCETEIVSPFLSYHRYLGMACRMHAAFLFCFLFLFFTHYLFVDFILLFLFYLYYYYYKMTYLLSDEQCQ